MQCDDVSSRFSTIWPNHSQCLTVPFPAGTDMVSFSTDNKALWNVTNASVVAFVTQINKLDDINSDHVMENDQIFI